MNLGKYKHIVFSVATGSLLLVGLFLLLNGTSQIARADPGDLFVKPGASGGCAQSAPCDLPSALGTATTGDTIYIAGGLYTGSGGAVVTVTQSITLHGGWDGAPTGPVVCDPNTHATTLDAEGDKRVVYVNGNSSAITVTLAGFTVTNGAASSQGAGLYIQDAVSSLRHMTVYNNVVDGDGADYVYGGGAYVSGGSLYITDSIFRANHCTDARVALHGGGLYISGTLTTTVESTLFEDNSAWNCGGMWFGYGAVLIRQSRFQDNGFNAGYGRTSYAGGLRLEHAVARIEDSDFIHNYAGARGGAMEVWNSSLLLAKSVISGNLATASGIGVAGIYLNGESPFILTNNIIVNNQPRQGYAGGVHIVSSGSPGYFLHNTIAGNTGSNGGYGIYTRANVTLTNNILVSHTVGISVTAGTAIMEGTLWGNGIDWGGEGAIVTGTVNIWGDPAFVNPEGGNYHIGPASKGIDTGVNAGVDADIDGDPRPVGAGYDIGADEFRPWYIFLPLVEKNYP